jgi:O-phosphoseryl-tRNA(Cys) synthetase
MKLQKNKTRVVLIPVDYLNSREVCESLENKGFDNETKLMKFINKELKRGDIDGSVLVYTLSGFMDEVNDQNLEVLTEYFISYVTLKE